MWFITSFKFSLDNICHPNSTILAFLNRRAKWKKLEYFSKALCIKFIYSLFYFILDTYKSRNRRDISFEYEEPLNISKEAVDISIAEKQILQELGPKACVMDEPCRIHAARIEKAGSPPNWNNILR